MSYAQNNDLGGKEYTEDEQALIFKIAMLLKQRDAKVVPIYNSFDTRPGRALPAGVPPLTPKHYMMLYVKAAGVMLETAKRLQALPLHQLIPQKTVRDWLTVLLGSSFTVDTLSSEAAPHCTSDSPQLPEAPAQLPEAKEENKDEVGQVHDAEQKTDLDQP